MKKNERLCLDCRAILIPRHKIKYCSNKCQANYQYRKWIALWRNRQKDGNIGVSVRTTSGHLRRYLIEKFNNKCSVCGWNKEHSVTRVVPLEIDHIDGNAENNSEDNLRLLCPNCHALTPFFKNMNKGKGRKWRMNKYIKNQLN